MSGYVVPADSEAEPCPAWSRHESAAHWMFNVVIGYPCCDFADLGTVSELGCIHEPANQFWHPVFPSLLLRSCFGNIDTTDYYSVVNGIITKLSDSF